ncbi:MAG: helix-turn-helix domain-containing protein [Clostridiaceae bacterium]|nr:helix-turn-helix domain-containing protein [Clostridiaceae bacterium]
MLGKQLKILRESRQKNQQEVCAALNIEQSTLANYENGKRMPKIEILIKLAEYYQCSVDFLLGIEKSGGSDLSNFQIDNSEFTYDFKMRIQDLMAEQELSEDEFAKRTGFSKEEKDDYLYGNKMPSIEDLIKIAGALNVSTDYLLDVSRRKRITAEEEMLLQSFNRCDDECKKYLLAKAGVLCVEGISAVAAGEYGKYADEEKKSFPSSGTEGKGA